MSKKSIKLVSAILTIAIVLMVLTTSSFAANTLDDPSFVNTKKEVNGMNNVVGAGEGIIGGIRIVGILVSVGILMVIGIKYMVGSAEEKATYKKTMMPYLVGAILLFGASTVATAVFNFVDGL